MKLSKARFFSKIDMKAAYHQIPMHPDSKEYTAFIFEFGLFEYLSMPMGISSSPSWFQRFIDQALASFISKNVLSAYLDDIIMYTETLMQHRIIGLDVINRLIEKNIKTSIKKSELVSQKIEFLGNEIENGEIHPLKKRAECIFQMKKPANIAELQRLLGMTNYSRTYIPKYAELVQPLYD